MRRCGEPPLKGVAYRDRPGAYGVLLRDGEVLLAMQHGALLLPGGGIDPGESPVRALHREVYEETGWRIGGLRRLEVFARYCWLPEYRFYARKVQHIYLGRPIRPLGPPTEPDHVAVWMRAARAVDHMAVAGEARALEAALRLPRQSRP